MGRQWGAVVSVGGCAGLRGGRGAVAAVGGGCGLILMLGHSLSGVVECQGPDSCMSAKCDSVLPLTEQAPAGCGGQAWGLAEVPRGLLALPAASPHSSW